MRELRQMVPMELRTRTTLRARSPQTYQGATVPTKTPPTKTPPTTTPLAYGLGSSAKSGISRSVLL